MEIVYFIVGALLSIAVGYFYSANSNKKRAYEILKQDFGKKPENKKYDFDKIKIFWQELKDKECQCGIDDTTWDDLNMDDIFARINVCSSSLGEQYLYKSLRNISFDNSKLNSLEKKITYLANNETDRVEVQKKLLNIGKRENNYYIFPFLDNINNYKLNNVWIYHIMQVILFSAIVLVICLRNMYACSFLGILF